MLNSVVATDTSLSKRDGNMARSVAIQIGELSRQTGCNVQTIRYYERVGFGECRRASNLPSGDDIE
jgi:MerR family regulatory protein